MALEYDLPGDNDGEEFDDDELPPLPFADGRAWASGVVCRFRWSAWRLRGLPTMH